MPDILSYVLLLSFSGLSFPQNGFRGYINYIMGVFSSSLGGTECCWAKVAEVEAVNVLLQMNNWQDKGESKLFRRQSSENI